MLLAQQENAFLDRSITRAKNETIEIAKKDKTNKQCISIDDHHHLPLYQLNWKQKARNASRNKSSSINRAFKQAKKSITSAKTVSFAPTQQVKIFQDKDVAAMITYDLGADEHYLSERDRKLAGPPTLGPSTKRVEVANGGTSTTKHVT